MIKFVIVSAAKVETAELFMNAKLAVLIRQTLVKMRHSQSATKIDM